MSSTADRLEEEIKSLPDADKVRLVEAILIELDRPDPGLNRVWAEEARKRCAASKSGLVPTISYEEVMSRHRDK
jgi:putative addiction module component (TIGR02574 family)